MNDLRNRSMLDFHPTVSETFYEIKGSAPLGVVEAICREINIDVQDFMMIKPDNDLLSFYGDVFGCSCGGG